MKKLECIIRADKVKDVEQALRGAWAGGMTLTDCKGFGAQRARKLAAKVKVEIYATDLEYDKLAELIRRAACTGEMGDGKIAILPLEQVMRIRTGEKGAKAIF